MKTIGYSNQFKRDHQKIFANPMHREKVQLMLPAVVEALSKEQTLPPNLRDHALTGNYKGHRECHLKPDVLLIYKDLGKEIELIRMGTHSELF
jgi:mRNA interferase YafQ